ncbi:MAG: ABC transporter permease [Helicobacteraceae bacterium]|nr:ABC transporter permease [Helicobacteraceae bacterium]
MSFFNILKTEVRAIFKDIDIVLTLFGGIIIYAFFYPQPYLNQSVTEVKVAIVDLDRSKTSRDVSYMIEASPQTKILNYYNSIKEAQDAIVENKIKGFIVIPASFERNLYLNKMPTISIGGDNNYFLLNKAVTTSAIKALLNTSAKFKVMNTLAQNASIKSAEKNINMFTFETHNLFNPDESYKLYVIPAVFVIILQQMFLMGTALLSAGYAEKLARGECIKGSGYFLPIVARVLLFTTLFIVYEMFYFGYVFEFFNIYKLSNIYDLLSFGTLYALSVVSMGLALGAVVKKRAYVTPIVLITSLPLVFSAAFVWPLQEVEELVLLTSLFFPSNPATLGFVSMNQMGASLSDVIVQYGLLALQVVFYMAIYVYVLNKEKSDIM